MRHFFTRSVPPFSRILLIESGSRDLFEELLSGLYGHHPQMQADLVTCYAGVPKNFRTELGNVYRVNEYPDGRSRQRLYKQLAANRYVIVGIICSAEPIMTKWKWMLAARLSGKVFVLNENGDYFWLDRGHLGAMKHAGRIESFVEQLVTAPAWCMPNWARATKVPKTSPLCVVCRKSPSTPLATASN